MVNIGPKIGIDGEKEYRQQINNIIQSTKTLKSEMKALETQTTKSKNPFVVLGNEMTKNAEKRKLLTASIDEQKAKLADLNTMMSASEKKYGESATQTLKWKQAVADAETELNKLNAELENTPTKLETMGSAMSSAGDKIAGVGKTMTATVTAPLVGLGVASVKAYSDWESAFTGVMKTVDETVTTTYADLEEAIKKMATETASSKEEIAGVAEAAGQLGVKADDIEQFTRTMVMLGDSTNLSAEEASIALARMMTITGESMDSVDNVGSAIVALGNSFATSESEIVAMSTRLASAGTIAGMSTQDILALSTAMSSVGIEAEAGGTAMTQTLTGISKAVSDGGEKLEQLASVSGMTAEQFSNAWKTSPVEALQAFISGLSQMNEAELNTYSVLDELGMSGIRQTNMLQSLALASDTLTDAVNLSNTAYEQNTALVTEAEKRYQTFEAKMNQTKEKISNVGVELGERLLPYVDKFLDGLDKMIAAWDNLSPGAQDAIVKCGLIVAAIGPLLMMVGKFITTIGQALVYGPQILGALSGIGTFLTGTMIPAIGSFVATAATVVAPFLPFIAIAAGVVAAGVLIYKNWDTIKEKAGELKEAVSQKWDEIKTNISEKWEEVKQKTAETWQTIQNKVQEHGGGIQGVIGTYMEGYKALWSAGFNFIDNLTGGTLSNIVNTVQTKMTDIKARIDENGGGIKGVFNTYMEAYKSLWSMGFNAIDSATGGTLSRVVGTVSAKLGEIRNTFTNLASEALNWGADLIANFGAGITSRLQALAATVSSMASTIRSYLHFSEPDKGPLADFHTYAPDMMKLFASGIENNLGLVESAVDNVAASVGRTMEQNTYTSNVGGVNIVVNARDGQSAEEIAEIVQMKINRDVMLSARAMA